LTSNTYSSMRRPAPSLGAKAQQVDNLRGRDLAGAKIGNSGAEAAGGLPGGVVHQQVHEGSGQLSCRHEDECGTATSHPSQR
jgi:hypothetical protein